LSNTHGDMKVNSYDNLFDNQQQQVNKQQYR